MKRISAIISAVIVAGTLSACADGRYGHSSASVAIGYGGYYDDYYGPGPFYDGYWGDGGVFYFSDGPGHPYRRDEGHHFRHEAVSGFHEFHGNRSAGMHHGGGGGHGEHEHN